MSTSRRLLVRLYPRQWRKRYGQEFELLLEDTPWSVPLVFNVVGAAGREWLLRTLTGRLVLGPMIAYIAWLTAQPLAESYPRPSSILFELTDLWIGFAVIGRTLWGLFRETKVDLSELTAWVALLLVGSVCWQWGMFDNRGAVVEFMSPWEIWRQAALSTTNSLFLLLVVAAHHQTSSPYRGTSRPLGLS